MIWNNKPVGTGFLVHESGLIATCYHVVRVAGDSPEGQRFIFEFLTDGQTRRAIVTDKLDPQHDIALLQLTGPLPKEVEPVTLINSEATRSGMNFQVIGFGEVNDPTHQYRYSSATGVIVGPTDRDGVDLLQLESKQVLRGMSGGPVIAGAVKGVVGLISARYNIDPSTGLWMRDTVWAARSEQIAALHPKLEVVTPRQPLPRWILLLSILIMVILGSSFAWLWSQRITPLPDKGFNVVVAELDALDENGNPVSSTDGMEISNTIFGIIKSATDNLPPEMQPNIRGPDEVRPIPGHDENTRMANAKQIADKHHATILIYGVVRLKPNQQQVELAFEIPSRSFNNGSEIIGPNRLGQPIPLTPGVQGDYETNKTFNIRTQALKYLVAGLAYFSVNDLERAVIEFRSAAQIQDWKKGEGREVAYMFIGTTLLRDYDSKTGSEQSLIDAKEAFWQAYEDNQDYARAYLGLGAVAREEAVANTSSTCGGDVNREKLDEANLWYTQSLTAIDQPPNAYVPAKAYFGLGQINLLIFCNKLPDWLEAKSKSQEYYSQVIQTYNDAGKPVELDWQAGFAYAERGWLAFDDQDWSKAVADTEDAIEIIGSLPGIVMQKWQARQWAQKGFAQKELCDLKAARTSYQQAFIHVENAGEDQLAAEELEKWKGELEIVEKMILEGKCD